MINKIQGLDINKSEEKIELIHDEAEENNVDHNDDDDVDIPPLEKGSVWSNRITTIDKGICLLWHNISARE
ncbi:14124_t:CDS:2 [Entrophospora sp. SA101]|nr:14124_t:CDS:2 [Entrophospora sp. SA101]